MHQVDLRQLRHLDRHVQRERDDDLKDDDERPEGQEALEGRVRLAKGQRVEEGHVLGEGVEPEPRADGAHEAHGDEDEDAEDDLEVDLPLELGALVARPAVVEHGLGLVAGVDDEALDEVGVLEHALPEEEVVLADGDALAPRVDDGAVEAVDLGRRHVALNRGAEIGGLERALLQGKIMNPVNLCQLEE